MDELAGQPCSLGVMERDSLMENVADAVVPMDNDGPLLFLDISSGIFGNE